MITLREHQTKAIEDIYTAWHGGVGRVLYVLPTGAGKTYIEAFIAGEFNARNKLAIIIAHRDVLCCQISESLAALGTRHNILAAATTVRFAADQHVEKFKRSYYDRNAYTIVASAQTLIKLDPAPWMDHVAVWIVDEAHHVLKTNTWGRCLNLFKNALGLGMTATPIRADKKTLGAVGDGVFDQLLEGPTLRDLIDKGLLSDYKIKLPPSSARLTAAYKDVRVTASGDYSPIEAKALLNTGSVYGDVVASYIQHVRGAPGLTFGQDIEHCEKLAESYQAAGVKAVALSSKTPHAQRLAATKDFKAGRLQQLVNCDLFGEGYDAPACISISMVRRTLSYAVFSQQFGRVLRTSLNKTHGIILDFVGNIYEHGLPDFGLDWSLNTAKRIPRKNNTDSSAQRFTRCTNPLCFSLVLLPAIECPECGHSLRVPRVQTVIAGELVDLPENLADQLRNRVRYIQTPPPVIESNVLASGKPPSLAKFISRQHAKRRDIHKELEAELTTFYVNCQTAGYSVAQALQHFIFVFNRDVLSVQTLSAADAQSFLSELQLYNQHPLRLSK